MSNRWFVASASAIALIGVLLFVGFTDISHSQPSAAPSKDLVMTDQTVGTGAEAVPNKIVTVHYTGWLQDLSKPDHKGAQFDSSRTRNEPFEFTLGQGQVIRGWDEGVKGMKVGGHRTLVVPPDLGYGARGYPPVIPPNSTLIFDVELLGVH